MASAGDCREVGLAVKSCMTGPVQRRCQCELIHHLLCCQILSGWACGSERRNVAYACVGPFSEGVVLYVEGSFVSVWLNDSGPLVSSPSPVPQTRAATSKSFQQNR